jgi:stress response protein YsnF
MIHEGTVAAEKDNSSSIETVLPIVAEEVVVGSSAETERVRVKKSVRTRDELVETEAQREDFEIESVPVGRVVDAPPGIRVEGDTTIIPVVEEVVVVEKRLVVKEELRVRKHRTTERRELHVPLRAEHVEVERTHSKASGDEAKRSTKS